MRSFIALIKRDVTLAMRQGGGLGAALSFILAFLVLIPLALGPDQNTLQRFAPGLMWLALLLAVMLTTERIFQQDYEDGTLDLLATSNLPLELTCLAKALAHLITVSLPIAIITPLLGILLNVETTAIPVLIASMIIGAFALTMIASIAGSVTAGLRRGALIVPLLVLPLYVPVIIFGVSASTSALTPQGATPSLLVLAGIALIATVLQPWASAAALRAYFR